MYDLHFHTVEPIFNTDDFFYDLTLAIEDDFTDGHFTHEENSFWFGVSVPVTKEISEDELDTLKDKVSDMLADVPTIWCVKSIVRDKSDRLIFLVDVGGPLGR